MQINSEIINDALGNGQLNTLPAILKIDQLEDRCDIFLCCKEICMQICGLIKFCRSKSGKAEDFEARNMTIRKVG